MQTEVLPRAQNANLGLDLQRLMALSGEFMAILDLFMGRQTPVCNRLKALRGWHLIIFKIRTVFIPWLGIPIEYGKLNKQTGANNVNHKK